MGLPSTNLFKSIPEKDYMGLFEKGGFPNYDKITDILGYKRNDVAAAVGATAKAVRHDDKMPVELKERLQEWAVIINLVGGFFKGDLQKVILWLQTPNPLLGDMSPRNMIRIGRYKKLLKFVQTALEENKR